MTDVTREIEVELFSPEGEVEYFYFDVEIIGIHYDKGDFYQPPESGYDDFIVDENDDYKLMLERLSYGWQTNDGLTEVDDILVEYVDDAFERLEPEDFASYPSDWD